MGANRFPFLGFGVGLRTVHYPYILEQWPSIDWFEIISENYMDSQGRPRYVLEQVAERYPIVILRFRSRFATWSDCAVVVSSAGIALPVAFYRSVESRRNRRGRPWE